jgi:hypothetical protein
MIALAEPPEDPSRIPCICTEDAEGNLIPNPECELHWHQVIDGGDTPPAWAFP